MRPSRCTGWSPTCSVAATIIDPPGWVTLPDNLNRAMLGVSSSVHRTPAEVPFPPRSILFMYTEGPAEGKGNSGTARVQMTIPSWTRSPTFIRG